MTTHVAELMGAVSANDLKVKLSRTDYTANAEQFLALYPDTAWQQGFYTWNGRCWELTADEKIERQIREFLRVAHFVTQQAEERQFPSTSREINEMVRALKTAVFVERQPPCWTKPDITTPAEDCLVMGNGILRLSDRRLVRHTPVLWTMTALPFDYNQAADCPQWEHFLGQVFRAEDTFVLQEWFGYCLTCDISQHKILALLGPPRSGKSVTADILCELLGQANVAALRATDCNKTFGFASTVDKRLIRFSDACEDDSGVFNGAALEMLLTISGGDPVEMDIKYRPRIKRHPHGAKITWVSNNMPRFNDPTAAIAGRFIPLRTTQSFLGREDVLLPVRLREELPGILNWSLAGLDRLHQRGSFTQTTGTAENQREIAELASPVKQFVGDRCKLASDATEDKDRLYQAFLDWCQAEGKRPTARNVFFANLKAAFPQMNIEHRPQRGAKRGCSGLRLLAA